MRHLELIGLPASGKSTIAESLVGGSIITIAQLQNRERQRLARASMRRRVATHVMPGSLYGRLFPVPEPVLKDAANFMVNTPEFVVLVLSSIGRITDLEQRKRAMAMAVLDWARYEFAATRAKVDDAVLFDECLCQRIASLLIRGCGDDVVERYIHTMPKIDGVICLELPIPLALNRHVARGGRLNPKWFRPLAGYLERVREALLASGTPVLSVRTDQPEAESVSQAREFLATLTSYRTT